MKSKCLIGILIACMISVSCRGEKTVTPLPDRESKIPPDAVKITPETDVHPRRSHSDEYKDPVPLPYPINTAGAEDSPFILPDGKTLYVWFTPNVKASVHEQIRDGVTGIYVSRKVNGEWKKPERVLLQDPGKLALDGCGFIQGPTMWFVSAREGYTGLHWFTSKWKNGKWDNWRNADFKPEYQVGELHITADGKELYFHSSREGGGRGTLTSGFRKKRTVIGRNLRMLR